MPMPSMQMRAHIPVAVRIANGWQLLSRSLRDSVPRPDRAHRLDFLQRSAACIRVLIAWSCERQQPSLYLQTHSLLSHGRPFMTRSIKQIMRPILFRHALISSRGGSTLLQCSLRSTIARASMMQSLCPVSQSACQPCWRRAWAAPSRRMASTIPRLIGGAFTALPVQRRRAAAPERCRAAVVDAPRPPAAGVARQPTPWRAASRRRRAAWM